MSTLPTLALSVRQPWAWALFNGKPVENRTKAAINFMHAVAKPEPGKPVRLAIHASKGMKQDEYAHARSFMLATFGLECPRPDELVRSAIIGEVLYTECLAQSASNWFFGPRALAFEQATFYPDPIACAGELGFFQWRSWIDGAPNKHSADGKFHIAIAEPLPWMKKWRALPAQPDLAPPKYIHAQQTGAGPLFESDE